MPIRLCPHTRWARYGHQPHHSRIERPGWRRLIAERITEGSPVATFEPIYAYITPTADGLRFTVTYEILTPGTVEDVDTEGFKTEEHAKDFVAGLTPEDLDEAALGERGSASIHVDLTDSFITVRHGEDNVILAKGRVQRGSWDRLWSLLAEMGVARVK